MSLKNLEIQRAYDTGDRNENVVNAFFVPALQEGILYKRLTGYFSSQVLALAARGIAGLIHNQGKMQLITSPVVSNEDFATLRSTSAEAVVEFVNKQFSLAMNDVEALASTIAYDHLRALAWMLREGFLEIKVLIPSQLQLGRGIFHSKVGIIEDRFGNKLSFSGSVNETAMGWTQNIEEFKVFKSWEEESADWVKHDEQLFEKYWTNANSVGFEAVPMPHAAAEKLITLAPADINELDLSSPQPSDVHKIRPYQLDAINAWERAGFQGILEMATGTGKTFTARQGIQRWKENKSTSLLLVTAPTQTVASQWMDVLTDLRPVSTFDGKSWRESLKNLSAEAALGHVKHIAIVTIQNTASSQDFLQLFDKIASFTPNHLLVGDEMHGLGAPTFRRALNENRGSRLGLSATPERWFDDEGTDFIKNYFGNVVYTFGLHEALTWIDPTTGLTPLCPYNYHPEFVGLDDQEMNEYLEYTNRIIMQVNKASDPEGQEILNRLLEKRAAVLKKANSKFTSLRQILSHVQDPSGTLIYCTDREQMNEVIDIVLDFGLIYRTFTGDEGTIPKKEFDGKSERDWILENFENQDIQILIAMKCLDEGVDIPSARVGIIMASTTNPREFIQRRGRLLRRAKGKTKAEIFDMIVAPIFSDKYQPEVLNSARNIMEKEMRRVAEFAQNAANANDISGKVLGRMLEMGSAK